MHATGTAPAQHDAQLDWTLDALASLRRELHGLRKLTADTPFPLVEATSRTVRLNLQVVDIDLRSEEIVRRSSGEFLEGIDIAGEESFEEWLREMRNSIADLSSSASERRSVALVAADIRVSVVHCDTECPRGSPFGATPLNRATNRFGRRRPGDRNDLAAFDCRAHGNR